MTNPVRHNRWFSSHGDSRARYDLMEPIPLQVEHMAVELVVEPIHQSGPRLWTMKTSAHWCNVHTSYFTHNWETHGEWEHLFPSCTGPKNLPITHSVALFVSIPILSITWDFNSVLNNVILINPQEILFLTVPLASVKLWTKHAPNYLNINKTNKKKDLKKVSSVHQIPAAWLFF